MYGGNLVGRDVRKVWREDNVVKLLQFTDGNGAIIVDYLRSLREVQSVAARKVLPPEEVREKVISDYRAALKSVVEAKVICCQDLCPSSCFGLPVIRQNVLFRSLVRVSLPDGLRPD